MTQDEIIEMARHIASSFGTRMCDENGDTHGEELYAMGIDDIAETIKLVAAKEREACAIVCDDINAKYKWPDDVAERVTSQWCADSIRARGEA